MNLRPPRPERGALPGCATLRDQRRLYSDGSPAPQGCRTRLLKHPSPPARTGRRRPGSACRPSDADDRDPRGAGARDAPIAAGRDTRYMRPRRARHDGASPSGKAADFDSAIPRFESWRPSQFHRHRAESPPYSSHVAASGSLGVGAARDRDRSGRGPLGPDAQTGQPRVQGGGRKWPLRRAMTTRAIPAPVHSTSAKIEDSTPKPPPVNSSGPTKVALSSP